MYHPDSTVDRCEDKADWCRYANCLRIKPFVAKRCQKTCNICQPVQGDPGPGSNLAETSSFANRINHFLSFILLIIIPIKELFVRILTNNIQFLRQIVLGEIAELQNPVCKNAQSWCALVKLKNCNNPQHREECQRDCNNCNPQLWRK